MFRPGYGREQKGNCKSEWNWWLGGVLKGKGREFIRKECGEGDVERCGGREIWERGGE